MLENLAQSTKELDLFTSAKELRDTILLLLGCVVIVVGSFSVLHEVHTEHVDMAVKIPIISAYDKLHAENIHQNY